MKKYSGLLVNKEEFKIDIKELDNLILFGSGTLIVEAAKLSIEKGIKTYIFAVERHLQEVIDKKSGAKFIDSLKKENIPFFSVDDINDSAELESVVNEKTIGIGLGETYTFGQDIIDMFNGLLFDFMVIKLPQYRGGAHFTWQILRGDRKGCWNIQFITKDMIPGRYDSGGIIKTWEYSLPDSARIPEDYFRIANEEGYKLFVEFINEIRNGKVFSIRKPDESMSMYFPRLNTLKSGLINWQWSVQEIERFICAFDEPYTGASSFIGEKRVFLKSCVSDTTYADFHPFISGLIYRIYDDTVYIAAKDGTLAVKNILDDTGKNIISSLKTGYRLYTPLRKIDDAMQYVSEYSSKGLMED